MSRFAWWSAKGSCHKKGQSWGKRQSGIFWCGWVLMDVAFVRARAQQKGAKGGEERSILKNN